MSTYFIILAIFIFLILLLYFCFNKIQLDKLFPKPELDTGSVAGAISQIIRTNGQIIIGSFVILVLTALLLDGKITSEAAMPIMSLIAGYILGSEINQYRGKKDK